MSRGMSPGTSLGEVGGDWCFMLISSTHQWSQDVCFITKNSSFLQNQNVVSSFMFPVFSSWSTKVQEVQNQYTNNTSCDQLVDFHDKFFLSLMPQIPNFELWICQNYSFFPIRWHLGHFTDQKLNQLINKINQQLDQWYKKKKTIRSCSRPDRNMQISRN